jgi:hypothetical protein
MVSAIDERLVIEAGIGIDKGHHELRDERGEPHHRFFGDVRHVQVGTLAIEEIGMMVVPHENYAAYGRDIRGVLGRDVIADSLVFGFDRDRGIATLMTEATFAVPDGAIDVTYEHTLRNNALTNHTSRRVATVSIDGKPRRFALSLGFENSRVRASIAPLLGLRAGTPGVAVEFDTSGTRVLTAELGIASDLAAGSATAHDVDLFSYDDVLFKTYAELFDGTLGLDFFRDYIVWGDWGQYAYRLVPRGPVEAQTKLRLERWGRTFATCQLPGCVTFGMSNATLHVEREPGKLGPIEVTLRDAKHPELPLLAVSLPAGVAAVDQELDPRYVRGELRVVDISPFPFPCKAGSGCVAEL